MSSGFRSTRGILGMAALAALMVTGVAMAHEHGKMEKGSHCALAKNVSKSAKMTEDGAVVTLEGKNAEAVKAIQAHLEEHKNGAESCPDCPMGMDGVSTKVSMTDKGGQVTMTGSNPDAIKAVQEWAKKPAGSCCGGKEMKS